MSNEELAKELDEIIQHRSAKLNNGVAILEHWRDGLRSGVSVEKL